MILIGIIIQLVIFTLLAIAIALPLAGAVCWLGNVTLYWQCYRHSCLYTLSISHV